MRLWILVVLSFGGGLAQAPSPAELLRAEAATRRLSPADFSNLPAPLVDELGRRACTVPQSQATTAPHNVVNGRFTSAAETDWAVLCSRGRESVILVFRGGRPADVAELASLPDANYFKFTAARELGFSRALGVAGVPFLRARMGRSLGPAPPPLDHDGLIDGFAGRSSIVWYWSGGHWLKLRADD